MKKFDFIDALRGLAIIGVLISHAQRNIEIWGALGRSAALSPWIHGLAAQGARGVQLFFIVSAITLCNSQAHRRAEYGAWSNFFLRRVFRIAPMFYAALFFYSLLPALRGRIVWPSGGHIVATMLFVNGWDPYWINAANAVVPGGWSVAVEMSFYIIFPLLFMRINSLTRASTVYVISLGLAIGLNFLLTQHPLIVDQDLWSVFCFLWLPNQFPTFALGFLTYFVLKGVFTTEPSPLAVDVREPSKGWRTLLWVCVVAMMPLTGFHEDSLPALYAYGIDFAILTVCLANYPSRVFVNRVTRYIGKISFSGYLVHFQVLSEVNKLLRILGADKRLTTDVYFCVLVIAALAVTVIVASVTYHAVELPGQNIGRHLIRYLRSKQDGSALRVTSK